MVLTDTVPIPEEKRWDGLTVLSIAPLLASAIRAVFEDGSVAELFDTYPEHHGQGFLFALTAILRYGSHPGIARQPAGAVDVVSRMA